MGAAILLLLKAAVLLLLVLAILGGIVHIAENKYPRMRKPATPGSDMAGLLLAALLVVLLLL